MMTHFRPVPRFPVANSRLSTESFPFTQLFPWFSPPYHWWSTEAEVLCGRATQLRLLWHINRSHRPATSEAVKFYWFQWPGFAQWLSTVHRPLSRVQSPWQLTRTPDCRLIKCLQRLLTWPLALSFPFSHPPSILYYSCTITLPFPQWRSLSQSVDINNPQDIAKVSGAL